MSLFIASLNSGSNGNCYYIGNGKEAVLIDAGISCRETERRMSKLGLQMTSVKAIFVSHEHSDHITGIPGISKKYKIPVYITPDTFRSSKIPIEDELICSFRPGQYLPIGDLMILGFPKFHDAIDPHSFIVEGNGVRIGIFTDIGASCKQVIKFFKTCNAVFLESNYCEDMLQSGNYPYFLKERIRGGNGHLSNKQALALFNEHRSNHLSHLILSHLSKNNNKPELVSELFSRHAGNVKIIVASRYETTELFCIEAAGPEPVSALKQQIFVQERVQLTLF